MSLAENFWEALGIQQGWLTKPLLMYDDPPIWRMTAKEGYLFDDAFWEVFQRFPFKICHVSYSGAPWSLEGGPPEMVIRFTPTESDPYKPPNRKGVRHRESCLNDEPGVTICICDPIRSELLVPIEPFEMDDGRVVVTRPASPSEILSAARLLVDYEAAARVRQAALAERARQKGIDGIVEWDEISDGEFRELRLAEARRDVDAALGKEDE